MQRFTVLLVAGLVVAAVVMLAGRTDEAGPGAAPGAARAAIDRDAWAEGVSAVVYGEDGAVSYTVNARRQVHFTDGRTELAGPVIAVHRGTDPRWDIRADAGDIVPNEDAPGIRVELSGNVEASGEDAAGHRTVILTEFLSFDPDARALSTDRPVTLLTTNIRQTAVGLSASLREDRIRLHRSNRGRYERELPTKVAIPPSQVPCTGVSEPGGSLTHAGRPE